ncbi:crotonase/enoyl-CoA hydratase family protein [Thermus thermamylovorans]|uniref:Crotonase/enoyl-CoA hydratase family protein n=1 Tax=Thermus thermamylovorans TaxID=2509362 RepID=A0A4Q9B711_9DEIN|nr:crotonase/enoyl-CoA hydratase family protein [Thermus thermamylovorans]TBH21827.1 crotonase/enoyl-CoA hydratase family protein [Thermus thermamylovorans]
MEGKKVLTKQRGSVLIVALNRPEVRNAVDGETADMLYDAIEQFRVNDDLKVLVLTGAGGEAFCSGFDLKFAYAHGTSAQRRGDPERHGPMGITRVLDVDKPTIAAIRGYCVAGGLELACWCDFRICDESSRFGVLNRRWGVPLIDGGTQRLPRIVGLSNALYLIETGVVINAYEALRMGLVQEVVPVGQSLDRALQIAEHMASYPQVSLRNDRRATLIGTSVSLSEGLKLEAQIGQLSLESSELQEGLENYVRGKRPKPPQTYPQDP